MWERSGRGDDLRGGGVDGNDRGDLYVISYTTRSISFVIVCYVVARRLALARKPINFEITKTSFIRKDLCMQCQWLQPTQILALK